MVKNLLEYENHDTLNPKIWLHNELRLSVKKKILEIKDEFIDYLKNMGIIVPIVDIHIVGSNASYNYTESSDLDIHFVVNYDIMNYPEDILQILFNSVKYSFNNDYDINIRGINAEIYVEDMKSNTESNGIYSVNRDMWIKFPDKICINIDQDSLNSSKLEWESKIEEVLSSDNFDDIQKCINDLYIMRKDAISTDGEYAFNNILFKEVRNDGYLDKLKDKLKTLKSDELSLSESREWRKLTKKKIWDYCKGIMLENLGVAYYKLETAEFPDKRKFEDLNNDEQKIVEDTLYYIGCRMAKAIGGEYVTY